jgi:membrane peptidoglycan carboxypeptidase
LLVLILRWTNPPTSMMMTIRRNEAGMNQRRDFRIDYRWVNWDQIALDLPLAVIASEDQNFPIHHVPNYEKFLTIFVISSIINNINAMWLKIT